MSSLPAPREVATPALADQWEADALAAIEAAESPEDVEAVLARIKVVESMTRLLEDAREREARWKRIGLMAERRLGELLGPAEHGGSREQVSSGNLENADKLVRHKARQVHAVPEADFAEYVDNAEKPSRAGLLRDAGKMAVHYSSATDEWATPQDFFDAVNAEFGFDLDVCALASSAKCARHFTPEDDGLAQTWEGVCWMNPPYGTEIGQWVAKAHASASDGATVVCLVPARTDTAWWHDHCGDAEVRFIKGRLRFGNADASAPFPNALVVFGRAPLMFNWEWR